MLWSLLSLDTLGNGLKPLTATPNDSIRAGSSPVRVVHFASRERYLSQRALQVVLVIVGLLFLAAAYLVIAFIRQEPAVAMMASVYATLGVFLLLAVRNPSAHRSLIAFTAWSSFAHAAVMAVQASRNMIQRGELVGVAVLAVIGVVLIALAPAKQSVERASAAALAHS